ncbi:MAG: hypothetical protein HYX48_03690 [Chlamydiales bacterium]|nr:hypothetical protein [Chlamydiales bacterium]
MSSTLALTAASRPHPTHDVDGVLPHILSYCHEKTLACVSRAFRDSISHPMLEVGSQILMKNPGHDAQVERDSRRFMDEGETLRQACERQSAVFLGYVHRDVMRPYFSEREIVELWGLFRQTAYCLPPDDRALIYAGEENELFRQLYASPAGAAQTQAQKEKITKVTKNFLSRESLRVRAERIFQGRFNHLQSPACLRELHLSQRERVSIHENKLAEFVKDTETHKSSYSVVRFIELETRCVELQHEEDLNFMKLWDQLREKYPAIFPDNVVERPMPRRAWLNAPENAARLQQITGFDLYNLSMLPPEIGRFSRLSSLSLLENGDSGIHLHSLPNELATLADFQELEISSPDFATIPEVLARVHAAVTIKGGNARRAILPEAVARQHCTGIMTHLRDFEREVLSFPVLVGERVRRAAYFMGLRREELAEIPFFLWFRDTYSIPYPAMTRILLRTALNWLMGVDRLFPGCFTELLEVLALFFLVIAYSFSNLLLDLPILLFNLLLDYTVQPLVSYCRSLLGYSPMVRL